MPKIMHAFKMTEISAVDRPAQAHAKAVIIKRALPPMAWLDESATDVDIEAVEHFAKRDFSAKAREKDAKSGAAMKDGSFPIEDKEDLKNAMRLAGRAKDPAAARRHIKARAKALGLESELSDAYKRDDDDVRKDMYQVSRFADLICSIGYLMQSAKYEADSEGDGSLIPAQLQDWLRSGAAIFQSMAKEEIGELLATINKQYPGVGKALAAGEAANHSDDKDIDMNLAALKKALGLPDAATEAEVTAAITKALSEASQAKADLEIAKAAMSDDEKAYHDGLKSDDEKKSFRSMSREDRKSKMAKRDELPEHVRKQLADADDMRKRLAALEEKDATETVSKRVSEIGMAKEHVETIKKAYTGDRAAVDKLLDVIKSLTNQVKEAGLFKELGDGRDNGGKGSTAYDELVAKADELRKKDTNLTKEQAFAKVYADPANADLAKRERAENRPAA